MIVGLRSDLESASSIHKFLKTLADEFPFMVEPENEHRTVPSASTIEQTSLAIPSLLNQQASEFIQNVIIFFYYVITQLLLN